jgi:hypothetical protein
MGWTTGVRLPVGAGNFSLRHSVKTALGPSGYNCSRFLRWNCTTVTHHSLESGLDIWPPNSGLIAQEAKCLMVQCLLHLFRVRGVPDSILHLLNCRLLYPVKSPCLTKHHAMKTYWGSEGIAPRILALSTRLRRVVSFTPRPLYPQGKSPSYPLNRRLGGPQSRSGHGSIEKNSQPPRNPIVEPVLAVNPLGTRVYPNVSGLAARSENCKWYSSLPLGAVVSLFVSQSSEFCRHNLLCCLSVTNTKGKRIFRYRLSPETFGGIVVWY